MKQSHSVFHVASLGIPVLLLSAGCNSIFTLPDQMADMQSKMGDMKDTMGNMNKDMGDVKTASHDQILDGAIKDMFDSNNTLSLSAPAAMMPAALIYAKNATADELIQYAFILMTDINQGQPDPSLQNADGVTYPAAINAQFDTHKAIERTILTLIGGLASQDKIAEVVSEQIDQHGLYEGATYSLLMFRYIGIETVILPEGDWAKLNGNDNLLTIQDAYTYLQSLDYIRELPYQNQLSFNVLGMLDKSQNVTFALAQSDLDYPASQYQNLANFIKKLAPSARASKQAQTLLNQVQQRLNAN